MARVIGVVAVVLAVTAALVAGGCGREPRTQRANQVVEGDADIGRQLIVDYGCGACHRIPGVPSANGLVGPPLDAMGRRSFIAGQLPNTGDNMVRWVTDPQGVEPGTAMPDLDISRDEAIQIAAYLEGLD